MRETMTGYVVEPRIPIPTGNFVDQYCAAYKHLFSDVRSYQCFRYLHLGMISEIGRKSLPAIAKAIGLNNEQPLLHFLTESPWDVTALRDKRLSFILQILKGRAFTLIIDESGDKKKGKSTDYVAKQYIGNLGKVENGIVSVNAYGVREGITFPLIFKVYKPQNTLKKVDRYKTKPQLAAEILKELQEMGFNFDLVLADSLYDQSETIISVLNKFELPFIVAIRSNHADWMPPEKRIGYNKWKKIDRIFSNGKSETRYIRELIFKKRKEIRYWQITTDTDKLPKNSSWYIMTKLNETLDKEVGDKYGLRTWVEYGFKQSKNEFGWADYRVTKYQQIERWWEIVCSAYLMVSLQSPKLHSDKQEGIKPPKLKNPHPTNVEVGDLVIGNWLNTMLPITQYPLAPRGESSPPAFLDGASSPPIR